MNNVQQTDFAKWVTHSYTNLFIYFLIILSFEMQIISIFPIDSKCAVLELLQDQGSETLAYRINYVTSGTPYPTLT